MQLKTSLAIACTHCSATSEVRSCPEKALPPHPITSRCRRHATSAWAANERLALALPYSPSAIVLPFCFTLDPFRTSVAVRGRGLIDVTCLAGAALRRL